MIYRSQAVAGGSNAHNVIQRAPPSVTIVRMNSPVVYRPTGEVVAFQLVAQDRLNQAVQRQKPFSTGRTASLEKLRPGC